MSKLNMAGALAMIRAWRPGSEVGFSVNADGESPTDGYMVAAHKDAETVIPVADVTEDTFDSYVERFADTLNMVGAYLGGWVDDAGRLYLDVSVRLNDRDDARIWCLTRDERAFYDVKEGQSVYVK